MKKKYLSGLVLMLAGALCALFGIEIRKRIQDTDSDLRARFPRRSEPRIKRKVWTDSCPFCRGNVQIVDLGAGAGGRLRHTKERCSVWEPAMTASEYLRSERKLKEEMEREDDRATSRLYGKTVRVSIQDAGRRS